MEVNVCFGMKDMIALHNRDAARGFSEINSHTDGRQEGVDPLSKDGGQQYGTRGVR
jgi:hypothetical protein